MQPPRRYLPSEHYRLAQKKETKADDTPAEHVLYIQQKKGSHLYAYHCVLDGRPIHGEVKLEEAERQALTEGTITRHQEDKIKRVILDDIEKKAPLRGKALFDAVSGFQYQRPRENQFEDKGFNPQQRDFFSAIKQNDLPTVQRILEQEQTPQHKVYLMAQLTDKGGWTALDWARERRDDATLAYFSALIYTGKALETVLNSDLNEEAVFLLLGMALHQWEFGESARSQLAENKITTLFNHASNMLDDPRFRIREPKDFISKVALLVSTKQQMPLVRNLMMGWLTANPIVRLWFGEVEWLNLKFAAAMIQKGDAALLNGLIGPTFNVEPIGEMLTTAVIFGRLAIFKTLQERLWGTDNTSLNGNAPFLWKLLHLAALNKYPEITDYLLNLYQEKSISLQMDPPAESNPLDAAAHSGDWHSFKMLLEYNPALLNQQALYHTL